MSWIQGNVWDAIFLISIAGALLFIWALYVRTPMLPWKFRAKVTWVCDGDSVWVRTWYRRRLKLRLAGIDAPESEQEFGEESQAMLDVLIGGKRIDITAIDRDQYGRYVAMIEYRGEDVCRQMLEQGGAWPYFQYFRNLPEEKANAYREAGYRARTARLGLWHSAHPEKPWDWRKAHRSLWMRFVFWLRGLIRRLFGKKNRRQRSR